MPARSKRSKANQENTRKKYRLDAQVDVNEPEFNEPLVSNAFAERQNASVNTRVAVGAESEWQPPHAKLVYFAEADKSLKRTIYPGGSKRTQRRWRAQLKSNGATRSLFEYNFSSSKQDTEPADGAIYTEISEMPVEDRFPGTDQHPGEDQVLVEDQSQSVDEHAHDETLGKVLETIINDTEWLIPQEVNRSLSDSLAKLAALSNPKLSDSELKNLEAIKSYFEDRLKGINKLESSLKISRYSYRKGKYMARRIREWAEQFQSTGLLPVASQRGKHSKRQSPLRDEDIKRKCFEFFRGLRPNNRTAKALKKFYEDELCPKIDGVSIGATISNTTVTEHLGKWGFSLGRHSQDVYFDGHERDDVVKYRQEWARRMIEHRSQMKEFDGEDCQIVIAPALPEGAKEKVLVTHDECYFNSNDDNAVTWIERGESVIKKKGQGRGLMVSDFYCACHGPLRFENQYARTIIEPGKHRDGYWTSDHMVAQLRSAIDIFEKAHPGCVAVFCFDQSSNHQAMSHDALVITKLTLNDKPNSVPIVDGFFEQDGQIVRQAVIYPENHEKAGQQKGIRTILKERNLWRDGLLLKCKTKPGELDRSQPLLLNIVVVGQGCLLLTKC
ncbi:hypothetical protein LIPSTDRAFT_757 [Lipomyces starkeyi NRRL Y-11557]|uniref:Uncharacterized protein n=1 Tax=Lipomyces starkeyi NRRL Y-11557 TaxID=675824 RepID=A0A1E3QGV5_LIPST|nr:hypothetical protein LIPSTDRAFT_757 [Lipomyces starkeyi NRRL Y-11557]